MSFARIQAYLGLDISAFKSGLEKANNASKKFKQEMGQGGAAGLFKGGLGAGVLIAGFKAVIQRAQDARDAAAKIGKTLDAQTAAVARYGDAWDAIKEKIAGAAVQSLGFINRAGDMFGKMAGHAIGLFQGRDGHEIERTMDIGEKAGANADRLGSQDALEKAKERGDKKRDEAKKKRDADAKKTAEEIEKIHTEGSEQFEKNRMEALSIEEQIAELGKKRADAIKRRSDEPTKKGREQARLDQFKLEAEIREKTKEHEKEITEYYEKQAKAILENSAKEQKAYDDRAKNALDLAEKQIEAEKKVAEAKEDLAREQRDFLAPSLAEVAGGKRGNSKDRARAKAIERDETTAKRLFDSGNKVSIFDSKTQRTRQVGSDFFQKRAADARKAANIQSSDQNPFRESEKALTDAGTDLKKAAADLKTGIAEMKKIEIEIVQ